MNGEDVYVAGNGNQNAKLWKNGTAQELITGDNITYASSVFVNENDICVVGTEDNNDGTYGATLWRNGVAEQLPFNEPFKRPFTTSIYMIGTDIYVAGYAYNELNTGEFVATLWKNGVVEILNTDGVNEAAAFSVFVK